MKRTIAIASFALSSLIGIVAAQAPESSAGKPSQPDAIDKVVTSVEKAEQALKSLRLQMTTRGTLPGGLEFTTKGELRVLRGTQSEGAGGRLFSSLEYSFGEGLKGRQQTARGEDGIVMLEQDPAFGVVYLSIGPEIVTDLEWAGTVLERQDLPGMTDGRAQTPLGSGMMRDLRRTFDLKLGERKQRNDEAGIWIEGKRKAGLDDQDPDLPIADRVELFVRDRDHALLQASYFIGDKVTQEVVVEKVEIGVALRAEDFIVDGSDLELRQVQLYAPMWEQIEQVLAKAEAKSEEGVVRPSKRD